MRRREHSTPTSPKPRPPRGTTHFRRRPGAARDAADCGWGSGFRFPDDGNVVVHADVLDDQELGGAVVPSVDVFGYLRVDCAAPAGVASRGEQRRGGKWWVRNVQTKK